jgi:hypothetical protein
MVATIQMTHSPIVTRRGWSIRGYISYDMMYFIDLFLLSKGRKKVTLHSEKQVNNDYILTFASG